MASSNKVLTPLPHAYKAAPATDEEFALAKDAAPNYPQIVGSILYASTITRPDLAHAAGLLARYISKWSMEHYRAAKHLLRYIRGTTDYCLTFDAEAGGRVLLGYADADWGGCVETRRSRGVHIQVPRGHSCMAVPPSAHRGNVDHGG
jgi:hypothetical protein